MDWINVESSWIEAVAYDGASGQIWVQPINGDSFSFPGTAQSFGAMLRAPSVGRVVSQAVKGTR